MQNLRSFQMGHVMLSIYFIISLMHMLQAQDPPVWDEGGQTVIETITENGGFGYMVLKWQFISSTEPTLISWLYESNIIMRKVPGLDAIGVGASHEDRVSYQENGLCSINPFSGCIRINSTTISDVGNYNIEITTTSGNLNGDGSVVSIAFDDPDGTIRKHCVVVIGEASYSLNTTSVVAENGTTVRTECPPDQVPSSFITIGIDGEETKCDGTPITSCETPNVNLFPGGSLKITFDFSSTPDVIINIKIEASQVLDEKELRDKCSLEFNNIHETLLDAEEVEFRDGMDNISIGVRCTNLQVPPQNITIHVNPRDCPYPVDDSCILQTCTYSDGVPCILKYVELAIDSEIYTNFTLDQVVPILIKVVGEPTSCVDDNACIIPATVVPICCVAAIGFGVGFGLKNKEKGKKSKPTYE